MRGRLSVYKRRIRNMKTKHMTFISVILFFITLESLITLDHIAKERKLHADQKSVFDEFILLQNDIGYVGLIHNFKNFILRPDQVQYRDAAILNYKNANARITNLAWFGDQLFGEISLDNTKAMLTAYKAHLDDIPEYIRQGLSAREIDDLVIYDDMPSKNEIYALSNEFAKEFEQLLVKQARNYTIVSGVIIVLLLCTCALSVNSILRHKQRALANSESTNALLQGNQEKLEHSQRIMHSVMKDMEQEKQQTFIVNEKLKVKNLEMEQFIYTVSHDLRSPLITISGFTKKLYSQLQAHLSEKQSYHFTRIIDSVKNMESLLSDLLDLSKLVQQDIVKTSVDTERVVTQQCLDLEKTLLEQKVSLDIRPPLLVIHANERLLTEAVLNLLTNAIKYKDPTRALVITIFTSESDSATHLHVQDNGSGIDPKYHQLVFKIFERLSESKGTGVGLTIVKTVMDKHDGTVSLVSEVGKGSEFTLSFPKPSISLSVAE